MAKAPIKETKATAFSVKGIDYEVVLTREVMNDLETKLGFGWFELLARMERNFIQTSFDVIEVIVKRVDKIGLVPIEPHLIGDMIKSPGLDEDKKPIPPAVIAAIVAATAQWGNEYGLVAPSNEALENGAE